MKAMQWRSPRGTSALSMASASLDEATLSPVSAASSISSVAVTNRRPSAGTRLPASISTMSPGTSCSASISIAWPSRRTRAMFFIIFSSAARLASALDSPRMPSTALKTVSTTSMIDVRTVARDHQAEHGRAQQDDLHEVLVLAQESLQPRFLLLGGQHVGAVLLQALLRFSRAQPLGRIDLQLLCHCIRRQGVPFWLFCGWCWHRFCHGASLPCF